MTLAVLGVAVGVAGVLLPSPSVSWPTFDLTETPVTGTFHPAAPARALSATPPAAQLAGAVRRIYRHSVVPGGVADKVELAQVLRTDRLVAAHYATFNVDKAHAVTVTSPRAVYVSYRKNDQIYWTSKKVMLEQGETLLTDGEHDIRARCANRISDVPQYPVETHGPSEAELDTVVAVAGPSDVADATGAAGEEGGMLAVGMEDLTANEAVGQRYYATAFANGAGLVTLADAAPALSRQGQAPGLPDWYNAPVYHGRVLGTAGRSGGSDGNNNSGSAPATGNGGTSTATPGTTVVAPAADSPASGNTGGTGDVGGNTGSSPIAAPDGGGSTGGSGGTGGTGSGGTGGGSTGGNTSGNTGGNTGGSSGGGAVELPVNTTPTVPTAPGDTAVDPIAPTEVPEPGTLWLGSIALAAMLWLRRKGARAG